MKINSCFVFALLLLLVSYSLALDKLQTDEKVKGAVDKVEPAGGGGGGGGNWGGGGGGGNWGGGGGGGCHHGCCYKGSYGCQKCCSSPEEAKAVAEKSQPQTTNEKTGDTDKVEPAGGGGGGGNWGGGGGGGGHGGGGYGCQHGCCYKGHYNNCNKCCSSPEEAKAVAEKEADVQNTQPEAKVEGVADKVKPAGGGGGNWGGGGGGNWGGGGGGHGGGGGNWGGGGGGHGGGGGCQHGCCYGGRGYGCQRCCSSPEEAKAVAAKQAHP